MKKVLSIILAVSMIISTAGMVMAGEPSESEANDYDYSRIRTVISTDLEIDDMDSLMHILLYANDFEIEAIVSSSSTLHFIGDGEHTVGEAIESYAEDKNYKDMTSSGGMDTPWISELIANEYAEVYPNLLKHDSRYSSPEDLLAVVAEGNITFPGDMREETEGSNLIKEVILKDDPRPLYLQAWGGTNTIGRALMSIEEEYKDTDEWEDIYNEICSKTTLISYGEQDNAYPVYIQEHWPDMGRLYCLYEAYVYATPANAPLKYQYLFKGDWLTENIKFNHGALMSKYYLMGDGQEDNYMGDLSTLDEDFAWLVKVRSDIGIEQYDFISEGDSGCFMYLIPVGLRGLENTNYGSWGGRMQEGTAVKEYDPARGKLSGSYSAHRWLEAFHNDWAARADWCVMEYDEANHQPIVSSEKLDIEAAPEESVELTVSAEDPDGDELSYNWFVYTDACSYSGEFLPYLDVALNGDSETVFTIPKDAQPGDYFNIIVEVSDNGTPSLTRYAQYIVTVTEE